MSLAVVAPSPAAAEQKLSVSPLSQTVNIDAGESRTVNITVGAPEDAITVVFFHQDFGFGKDYDPILIPDDAEETTAFSTRRWFSVPNPTFRVPAGQSRTVPVKVTVPDNTPAGTYIGTATFAVDPGGAPEGGQVQTRTGIASVIFVGVNGGAPPKPHVRRFDVARMSSGGRLEPQLVLENRGSLPFSVSGTVRVDGKDATDAGTLPNQYVIPGRARTLHTGADNSQGIRIDTDGLGIGRHEVEARLRIDPLNDTIVVRRTFWLIPIWLRVLAGIAVLGTILLVSWIVIRLRRRGHSTTTSRPGVDDEDLVEDVEIIDEDDIDEDDIDDDDIDDDEVSSSEEFDDEDSWSEELPPER